MMTCIDTSSSKPRRKIRNLMENQEFNDATDAVIEVSEQ